MAAIKLTSIILFISCSVIVAASIKDEWDYYQPNRGLHDSRAVLTRLVRSPKGGSVSVGVSKDQHGREASVQYNQNLYKSRDGRGSIDAYGQASRNFDQNRNNVAVGVKGTLKF